MAMRTTNQIRKGNDLMVFLDGVALAFATNHTLTLTTETEDIQSKDNGYDGAVLPKRVTWEIQSENLYIDGEYEKLFDAMASQQAVSLSWGTPQGDTSDSITSGSVPYQMPDKEWDEPDEAYRGNAFITSLTVNAQAGENATYSVTFTGSGPIGKN